MVGCVNPYLTDNAKLALINIITSVKANIFLREYYTVRQKPAVTLLHKRQNFQKSELNFSIFCLKIEKKLLRGCGLDH